MAERTFIVAEVSKNWDGCRSPSHLLLCQQFEEVIEVNRKRGYRLHSFELSRTMTGKTVLNETIIAVFEKTKK